MSFRNRWPMVFILASFLSTARAQVLSPEELTDSGPRTLQQRHMPELKALATELQSHLFPYPFYFSRVLDVDEERQRSLDQRSIRFEKHDGQSYLTVTGNYFVSYSSVAMETSQRVRQTMEEVVLPILRAELKHLADDESVSGFAFEVSHHVRRKVFGMPAEHPENVVFLIPRSAAQELASASETEHLQAALLESQIFVDAEPFNLWVDGERREYPATARSLANTPAAVQERNPAPAEPGLAPAPTVSTRLLKAPDWQPRAVAPATVESLDTKYGEVLGRMVNALASQAQFVSYAPPRFVTFHQRSYLQLSLTTALPESGSGSRYRLAALAFDDQVAHLVRPVLLYFPQSGDFDGIVFSTTLKRPDGDASTAVEYFLPLTALRSFADYECTGQKLLDSGMVLINGERAELNLQLAEADGSQGRGAEPGLGARSLGTLAPGAPTAQVSRAQAGR